MSKIAKIMQQAAAGAVGEALAIEDVFSTYLYTGNSSTQTITNGIDLAGEGGLVWLKTRSSVFSHRLLDTEIGLTKTRATDAANADLTYNPSFPWISSFDADGFTLGNNTQTNYSGYTYASWTFRKAPRFFDVVTWTGDGTAGRSISHSLGVQPGFIAIKATSSVASGDGSWVVAARKSDGSYAVGDGTAAQSLYGFGLNLTNRSYDTVSSANANTFLTDTSFAIQYVTGNNGSFQLGNAFGVTYVAYLFAHDPLGPSGDGSDGLIACGSAVCDSNGFFTANLGFEPQWILVKGATIASNWHVIDVVRGMSVGTGYPTPNPGPGAQLYPNISNAEVISNYTAKPTATGFEFFNGSSTQTYIYIAIRRGPMREPTSGTQVFAIDKSDGTSIPSFNAGFPIDTALLKATTASNGSFRSRLTGTKFLETNNTNAEGTNSFTQWDYQDSWYDDNISSSYYSWMFRRAPGFFDMVAYSGTSTSTVYPHNLNAVPELVIIKNRTGVTNWKVWHKDFGTTYELNLNSSNAVGGQGWINTLPTSENITVGVAGIETNTSGYNYIAYLFATLPGVSKVGSYTGNGSSQTINCGFTGGARFVLIKRTDDAGDWYVWDTARGIVSGNDPYLRLNSTAAEVTTNDTIDPDSSGFIVNQVGTTSVNVSSASYIFYAVA